MRPIVIVLIVVALGAAVLTAFLATRFLASVQQQPAQVAQEAAIAGICAMRVERATGNLRREALP